MKLAFVFFIILLLSFSSCQKEYPIYQEEGKKIAQLLSIDEENVK